MMIFGILPEHPVLVFPAYQAFSNLFILFLSAHVKTVVNDHEPVVNRFTLFASSGRGRPPGPSYTTVPPSTLRPTRPPVMMRMTNVQLFLSWGSWEYCTGGELLSISPIMGQIKHILRWTLGATWATIPTINKDHFSKLQTSLKSVRSFNTFFKGSNCTKIVFSKPSRHYNIRGVKSLWFWKSLKNVFFTTTRTFRGCPRPAAVARTKTNLQIKAINIVIFFIDFSIEIFHIKCRWRMQSFKIIGQVVRTSRHTQKLF